MRVVECLGARMLLMIRGQLLGIGSVLELCGSWRLNSGMQGPLPASHLTGPKREFSPQGVHLVGEEL